MKASKKWLIIIGIFFAVALTCLLLGFHLSGYDVLGWFGSKYAVIVYVVLGIYLLALIYILVKDKLDKSY